MRKLGLVLVLAVAALAEDSVRRVHEVSDLAKDDVWWPVALAHVRSVAGAAEIRLERAGLVLDAPAAVHERVATALREVRAGRGVAVTIEVHFARVKGGAVPASVPAAKVGPLLKERIGSLTLPGLNLQRVSGEVAREVPYVADFDVECGMGGARISDPVIDVVKETWTARLRPVVADGSIRVVAEFSVTEIARPIPDFWTLIAEVPLKIQLPEARTRTVARAVACAPAEFAVVDLGESTVALVRATAAH